jgi:hypothetical protein
MLHEFETKLIELDVEHRSSIDKECASVDKIITSLTRDRSSSSDARENPISSLVTSSIIRDHKIISIDMHVIRLNRSLVPALNRLCDEMRTNGHDSAYVDSMRAKYMIKWTNDVATMGDEMNIGPGRISWVVRLSEPEQIHYRIRRSDNQSNIQLD